jgi:hypothetical protein
VRGIELRRLVRQILRSDHLVAHLAGADGPLLRALALVSRKVIVVPPPAGAEGIPGAGGTARSLLEGSHRVRVARVVSPESPDPVERRVHRLPLPGGIGPVPLPLAWKDWLIDREDEAAPLLTCPRTALRLLAAAAR